MATSAAQDQAALDDIRSGLSFLYGKPESELTCVPLSALRHVLSTVSTLSAPEAESLLSVATPDEAGNVEWEVLLRHAVLNVDITRRPSLETAALVLHRSKSVDL